MKTLKYILILKTLKYISILKTLKYISIFLFIIYLIVKGIATYYELQLNWGDFLVTAVLIIHVIIYEYFE